MQQLLVVVEGLVESQTEPEGRDTTVKTPQSEEADGDPRPLLREREMRQNVDINVDH